MKFCIHMSNNFESSDLATFDSSLVSLGESIFVREHTESNLENTLSICLLINHPVVLNAAFLDSVSKAHSDPSIKITYTDHSWISSANSKHQVIRPPAWSPERFLSVDYLGPVICVNSEIVDLYLRDSVQHDSLDELKISELRTEILLSSLEVGHQIKHVEVVGYSVNSEMWIPETNTRREQIQKFLSTHRPQSKILNSHTPWGIVSNVGLAPNKISIVIPTRGSKKNLFGSALITECIKSLLDQDFGKSNIEVIIVFDSDVNLNYLAEIKKIKKPGLELIFIEYPPPFNFSKKCNLGAESATGEVVLFLNDDTIWISPNSLLEIAGCAMLDGVGAVGSKLLFENGSIQHAGYIMRNGFVGHAYMKDVDGFGPFGDLVVTHEVVGVTGACLAQRKEIWESVGKWNESFPASYNDVDYCFRITESGLSILQVNQAKLKHFESVTRNPKVYPREREMIEQLWGHKFKVEPFFRMAVTTPEMRAIRGNTLVRYVNYARATFRRQGVLGLWGLLLNVGRKTFSPKAKT